MRPVVLKLHFSLFVLVLLLLSSCATITPKSNESIALSISFQNTQYTQSYWLSNIDVSRAYEAIQKYNKSGFYEGGGPGQGIRVGIIDSGLNVSHSAFTGRVYKTASYLATSSGSEDKIGHGTAVATLIAGNRYDSMKAKSTYGIAYGSELIMINASTPVQSDGTIDTGSITISNAMFDYLIAYGARVINLSAGSSARDDVLEGYIATKANNSNVLIAIATGNSGEDNPYSPAIVSSTANVSGNKGSVIAVTAVDSNDNITSYSNRCGVSALWCVAAYGNDMISASTSSDASYTSNFDSEYVDHSSVFTGTSFATPIVSGMAATLMSAFPSLNGYQIGKLILIGAVPTYDSTKDSGVTQKRNANEDVNGVSSRLSSVYGWGVVNLYNSVNLVTGGTVSTTSASYRSSSLSTSSVVSSFSSGGISSSLANVEINGVVGLYNLDLGLQIRNAPSVSLNPQDALSSAVLMFGSNSQNISGQIDQDLGNGFGLSFSYFANSNERKFLYSESDISYNLNSSQRFLNSYQNFGYNQNYGMQDVGLKVGDVKIFGLINNPDSTLSILPVAKNRVKRVLNLGSSSFSEFDFFSTMKSSVAGNFQDSISNGFSFDLAKDLRFISLVQKNEFITKDNRIETSTSLFGLEKRFGNGYFGRASALIEKGSFLGSAGSGAMAFGGAGSGFVTVGFQKNFKNFKLEIQGVGGASRVEEDGNSIFRKFSTVYSSSFRAMIGYDDFSFEFSSPLAISSGNFDLFGKSVNLASQNRELDYTVSYKILDGLVLSGSHISNPYGVASKSRTLFYATVSKKL